MLLTGPLAMLSMPSFDFHLPPCTEGFLIHLSPLWQLPLWQLPLFPSVAQFPCVGLTRPRRCCDQFDNCSRQEKRYPVDLVMVDYNARLQYFDIFQDICLSFPQNVQSQSAREV